MQARRASLRAVAFALIIGVAACGSRTGLFEGTSESTPTGPVPMCGNGVLDPSETCDDGNVAPNDSCTSSCTKARCGDGIVQTGVETCDDGNRVDNDACRNNCGPLTCGDGIVQSPETCDDGNADDADACLSSCVKAVCGDGYLRAGVEQCDDGDSLDTNDCVKGCRNARCGDGFTWAGHEACDDGNTNDLDLCDNDCKLPVCGDGKVAGNEECDLGPDNGDRPAFLVTQPSGLRFGTNPLVRAKSAMSFYDYRSASSHTGFEQAEESRIYLYVDSATGRLSLVLTHGIDFDSSGTPQPTAEVQMDVTGLPSGVAVEVADDNTTEFFSTVPGVASGRWVFGNNSDGGVLGAFPFPGSWKVVVTPRFIRGITTWGWVTHTLARMSLKMDEPITIEAFAAGTACRKTCTIPKCGDGILDGGEVCDDGNTVSGDGCSATCTALQ
jgi:cysteine-rich repeat protein